MKIVFLGFGGIGQETLNELLHVGELRNCISEIVILCRNIEKCKAIYEDILDGFLVQRIFENHRQIDLPNTVVTDDYCHIEGANVIICCYGVPSTFPMHDRQALLEDHLRLSEEIFIRAKPLIPIGCQIINAVNPVDSISYFIDKILLNSRCNVIGIGAAHNTARLLKSICRISNLAPQLIDTGSLKVCGEHGDGLVPLLSLVNTYQGPLIKILSVKELEDIIIDTRSQGLAIFHKMKRPPKYGPTASILTVIMRLIKKDNSTFCGSIWLPEREVFMSWPLTLQGNIFKPLNISTNEYEQQQINLSVIKLKNIIKGLS